VVTLARFPGVTRNFQTLPATWVIVPLNALAIANIPRAIYLGRPFYAFVSSCCTILALTCLFGLALFPNLLVSSLDPAFTLTIHNACSSRKTLGLMLKIALLGMPFVLTYTGIVYWVFRGKVKLNELSYLRSLLERCFSPRVEPSGETEHRAHRIWPPRTAA